MSETSSHPLSDEDALGLMGSLSNWGRWGEADELGTLNFVTAAATRKAAQLVRSGDRVSLARLWKYERSDYEGAPEPPMHEMVEVFDVDRPNPQDPDDQFAYDRVAVRFHSREVTHLDSLSHCFWEGQLYNGRPSGLISQDEGATVCGIEVARAGVVTRGILIDVATLRGVDHLPPHSGVTLADVEAASERYGIEPESGDAVFLRGGQPTISCGPLLELLPFLHEREVALLGSDMGNEVRPSGFARFRSPVHQVGIVAMGLWILDAADLEDLAATCRRLGRYEFCFMLAPLTMPRATGSPVNPLAIF